MITGGKVLKFDSRDMGWVGNEAVRAFFDPSTYRPAEIHFNSAIHKWEVRFGWIRRWYELQRRPVVEEEIYFDWKIERDIPQAVSWCFPEEWGAAEAETDRLNTAAYEEVVLNPQTVEEAVRVGWAIAKESGSQVVLHRQVKDKTVTKTMYRSRYANKKLAQQSA